MARGDKAKTPQQQVDSHSTSSGKSPAGVAPAGGSALLAMRNPEFAQPQDLLQLQRTVGNRAVNHLIRARVQPKLMVGPANDRYEQEADQTAKQVMRMQQSPAGQNAQQEEQGTSLVQRKTTEDEAGFEPDSGFQQRLAANKSGGAPLPSSTRSFMEQRFNSDFSGVKVHTGSNAIQLNRDIQAKAFTHGSNIYFNRNAYAPETNAGKSLLAHELTHVVQQGAAVQRTPADGKTPKIQRKGEGLIQRFSLTKWISNKFSKKKDSSTSEPSKTSTSSPPVSDTDIDSTPPDVEREDAQKYEQNLGRYAYNHSKASTAAKSMMDKMTSVLIGDLDESNKEQMAQVAKTYGTTRPDAISSAGQVGSDIQAVMGVLKSGNLRERLTALMNAMFGPFKEYIKQAMKDSAWNEMEKKGLNVNKLKRRKRQMGFNPGAKDLFRDPGNPLDRKKFSTWQLTGNTRSAVKQTSGRTVNDLDSGPFGIGLSEREKAFQFGTDDPSSVQGDEKLKWMEGGTYWSVNHKNKWVKKVENSLHMPVVAGPSGTMLRMFQTWEYLNKPVSAEDWRLAVLGWMLTSNDHSFHEMMLTSADFGLPYTPGHMAYLNVLPLSLSELRQHVAEGGLFPHEHSLVRKVQNGDVKHLMNNQDLKSGKDTVNGMTKEEQGAISGPGAAAIDLYTGLGYLILNPTRKGGKFAKMQIGRNIKKKDELSDFRDDYNSGDLKVEDLMKEAKDIIPTLDTALESLPDWSGDLFRGTGTFSPFTYSKGSSVRFGAYTSSTLDEDTAKGFADDYNIGPFKYILNLKVTAGKDIRKLSQYASEDEILIPPGSEFVVKDRKPPKSGRRYYQIFLEQTKRGGMGLKLDPDKISSGDSGVTVSDSGKVEAEETMPSAPKPTKLTLYDEHDVEVGFLEDPSDVKDEFSQITNGDGVQFVEIVTSGGKFYWTKKDELYPFLGKPHTPKNIPLSKELDDSSSKSEPEPISSTPPKPESITLYDSNDMPLGVMTNASEFMAESSEYTNDEGIEWIEIVTQSGYLYWTKKQELYTFLGKPYTPKTTPKKQTTNSDTPKVMDIGEPSTPKTTSVSSQPKVEELTLYDSNDIPIDKMPDPTYFGKEIGEMTNDEGVEWVEILSKDSMLYWVKKQELYEFLGKPYIPKKSKSKSSSKSELDDLEEIEL